MSALNRSFLGINLRKMCGSFYYCAMAQKLGSNEWSYHAQLSVEKKFQLSYPFVGISFAPWPHPEKGDLRYWMDRNMGRLRSAWQFVCKFWSRVIRGQAGRGKGDGMEEYHTSATLAEVMEYTKLKFSPVLRFKFFCYHFKVRIC